jgi:hypothetical protein
MTNIIEAFDHSPYFLDSYHCQLLRLWLCWVKMIHILATKKDITQIKAADWAES